MFRLAANFKTVSYLRRLAKKIMPEFDGIMDEYGMFQDDVLIEIHEELMDAGYDFSLGRFLFAIDNLEPIIFDYLDDHDIDPSEIVLEVNVPEVTALINNKPIADSTIRL